MKFIGLIGCGYWGKNLIREFYNTGALHTICDTNKLLLNSYAEKYPNLKRSMSWADMLNNKDITAICVSLPAFLHFKFVKEALEADKNVFVEKPLALTLEDGKELVELAKKRKKILMVGHLLQYHPCVQKIYSMIENNKIGDIRYVVSNRLNLGKFRQEENVLWSFAPHDISVILSLMGNKLPKNITCNGHSYLSKDIHDVTTTLMEFDNGKYAQINVNWLNPFKEQKMVIVGTNGMIIFEDTAKDKLIYYSKYLTWNEGIPNPSKPEPEIIKYGSETPLKLECVHFIQSCKTNNQPATPGDEGLRVLTVLDRAQYSLMNSGIKTTLESKNYFAHETAIIDDNVNIGDKTKIWHFSHVMKSIIGKNCNIGQNVFIGENVILGNHVKVQNNVSIYAGVECEDYVFFGPSCVLTNDLNPRCMHSKNGKYVKTIIKKGASIGANATIVCGITLGEHCLIGAGAVVTKDVPPNAVMVGNPAKIISTIDEFGNITKCENQINNIQNDGKKEDIPKVVEL